MDEKKMITNEHLTSNFSWKVEDVAKALKCTPRHIYELVSLGKIPYAKVGRLVRFSPTRIQEWIDKGGTR